MTALPDEVRFAVGTLSRAPVPAPSRVDARTAGRGLALGPLVGALLGLVSGLPLVWTGPDPVARLLGATISVALAAWLTRALHWDGLADLADGLGSRAGPDRALEIMRQSDIGPFGVLTLVLTLALQVLALALLPAGGPALAGWVAALTLGRLALVLACGPWTRAARPDGLGAMIVGSVTWSRLAVAAGSTGAILLIAATVGPLDSLRTLLVAPLCAAAVAAVVTRTAARRLGGSTGDTLGGTVELATTAALLALVL